MGLLGINEGVGRQGKILVMKRPIAGWQYNMTQPRNGRSERRMMRTVLEVDAAE